MNPPLISNQERQKTIEAHLENKLLETYNEISACITATIVDNNNREEDWQQTIEDNKLETLIAKQIIDHLKAGGKLGDPLVIENGNISISININDQEGIENAFEYTQLPYTCVLPVEGHNDKVIIIYNAEKPQDYLVCTKVSSGFNGEGYLAYPTASGKKNQQPVFLKISSQQVSDQQVANEFEVGTKYIINKLPYAIKLVHGLGGEHILITVVADGKELGKNNDLKTIGTEDLENPRSRTIR
jgi:hypothetical protein